MKRLIVLFMLVLLAGASAQQNAGEPRVKILINHVGYDADGPKHAVIQGYAGNEVSSFAIKEYETRKVVLEGETKKEGPVAKWKNWHYWSLDFDAVTKHGKYYIECKTSQGAIASYPFLIEKDLLEKYAMSNVIFYFRTQRTFDFSDRANANLPMRGNEDKRVDVRGGWQDASGDYGMLLSHLSSSNYFNPQQTSLTAWTMFNAHETLLKRNNPNYRQMIRRLAGEAIFGADFLVRLKVPERSFYVSISGGPLPDKAPEDRRLSPSEATYRAGGGMAIAALAMAGRFDKHGDFSNAKYLQTAEDAFAYLGKNNPSLVPDKKENIVDDYCALMAATELYKTTKKEIYKAAATKRANSLLSRLVSGDKYKNYWRADDKDRPFFHAAEAGFPVVSLLTYYAIAEQNVQKKILATIKKSFEGEFAVTEEVTNPFNYARQYTQDVEGNRRTRFFFPHQTETGWWWQGENARLGSLATAAKLTAEHFKDDKPFHNKLQSYAASQLNWILGCNPYDICMLHGSGHNNPFYWYKESWEYYSAPGGIINGITGGLVDEDDIDFQVPYSETKTDHDWRWGEQWIPHASWFLNAISIN